MALVIVVVGGEGAVVVARAFVVAEAIGVAGAFGVAAVVGAGAIVVGGAWDAVAVGVIVFALAIVVG